MKADEKINYLQQVFHDAIYSNSRFNNNETYIELDPAKIQAVSAYIAEELSCTLVSMFASDESRFNEQYAVYYVFADRENGQLIVIRTVLARDNPIFSSITESLPAAFMYEREIHDMFGWPASGHPDLKRLVLHGNWPDGEFPLRQEFPVNYKPPFVQKEVPFLKVLGEGVYEIPVGPVHAGIIEPGHFRFSVAGEPIINLEAQLYYVHKGIEKICINSSIEKGLYISERISGDESFTNSLAYCQALEKIAQMEVPPRAQYIRVIFAELERLTSHMGDLAGVCMDIGYGFAASQFNMLRAWSYTIADELCGMRFLRSVNRPGGIRKDFVSGKEKTILEKVARISRELEDTVRIIKSNGLFMDRVENKGIVSKQIAVDLNAVGPAARAAGINHDVRKDFPYDAYSRLDFKVPQHGNGDVNCRVNVKIEECFESLGLIEKSIHAMLPGTVCEPVTQVQAYRFAFGMTEAPRGENIHWLMTGENNTLFRYKIRTPSFCNWPVLCHAVRGNLVPDFPLINKSFNLSYAGNDL